MIPIYQNWCVQIDITSHCFMSCLYCSRYNRHLRKDQRQHMSVDQFIVALESLKNWPTRIGIIGGEPLMHPEFATLCKEIQKRFPKQKMALWTSGPKQFKEHKDLIDATFGFVAYNEHNEVQQNACKHQPLTLSISEVIPDVAVREALIDDCWVQRTWCATINHFGAYFCEVAAAQDALLNGGVNAWAVTEGWWNKRPEQFMDQVNKLCGNCGMAIPIERELIKNTKEKFTPKLLEQFRSLGLSKVDDDAVTVYDKQLTKQEIVDNIKTWYPGNYRGDIKDDLTSSEGRGFRKELK